MHPREVQSKLQASQVGPFPRRTYVALPNNRCHIYVELCAPEVVREPPPPYWPHKFVADPPPILPLLEPPLSLAEELARTGPGYHQEYGYEIAYKQWVNEETMPILGTPGVLPPGALFYGFWRCTVLYIWSRSYDPPSAEEQRSIIRQYVDDPSVAIW